ncbi:MAG: P-loop NTPase, partial [Nitrospirae bacterium]|nr:P-loop NTPase [Nitrospirota bacterium]
FIPDLDGAVVVTIPTEISLSVVKKSIAYARGLGISILGLVENMSGFVCPGCGVEASQFEGETQRVVSNLDIPLLGKIPFDRNLSRCCDRGEPLEEGHFIARRFSEISGVITELLSSRESA